MTRSGPLLPAIRTLVQVLILGFAFPNLNCLPPERFQPQNGLFATPLTDASIDNASFAEWFDDSAHAIVNPTPMRQILWTLTTAPSTNYFVAYGASNHPGLRRLRVGFTAPVPVGSVLVRGGGTLSVLRPNAPYPGDLADDSQWIPAQRIPVGQTDGQPSTAEVPQNGFALWTLPPNTQTRALRFTHTAVPTDSTFAGQLGSLYILSSRFANLAPEGGVFTSANPAAAPGLHDETLNGNHEWDNGPDFDHTVSTANPEWITLVWPHPVALRGLAALMAGFNAADAQIFVGPGSAAIRNAPANDWQPVGQPYALRNQYPISLAVDWLDFGKTVQTRAVRLRLTQATNEDRHSHLKGATRNGNRVWLDELMALAPLTSGPLQSAIPPASAPQESASHPPIPIHFTLPAAGYVSLVIDDAQGNRVRNLVSDTPFPAGQNTAWWDGSDDLSRDREAADHGQYYIPTHFVAPGQYRVRGIVHQPIDLRYEFSVYSAGNPPWDTLDGTGGWLTNHTPPSAALFLPADKAPGGKPLVYLGSYVSEGGSGLAWVDLNGNKQGGRRNIGNSLMAAQVLARDDGPDANPNVYVYTAATWGDEKAKGEALSKAYVLVSGLSNTGNHADKQILNYTFDLGQHPTDQPTARPIWKQQIGGLAVRNNVVLLSLQMQNKLVFADAADGNVLGAVPIDSPRGLAFDAQGNLFVVSGTRLLRFNVPNIRQPQQLPAPQILIAQGLASPSGIALDSDGTIYLSDQGDSNQVKVFSPSGKFLRAIGHPGPSKAGPYDPLHMNNPRGLAIDSNRHLWVAEEDLQPKRVSLWTLDGTLIKAFYGPTEYGGGGSLDPTDKTRFYYHSMEFKLDWTAGTSSLAAVLHRDSDPGFPMPNYATPETVEYDHGHRYFDNTWVAYPSNGVSIAMLYLDTGGLTRPVAALGRANDWSVLKDKVFAASLPPNANLNSKQPQDLVLFTWSDVNGNGKVDPEEVTFLPAKNGSVTVMPDLSMVDEYVDGKAMRYTPVKFTPQGVPVYDIHHGQVIAEGSQPMASDGGGQAIYSPSEVVLTTAPTPFAREGLGGIDSEGHRWSYPSLWPGLHPSHNAPIADRPGEIEGTTRLLGGFVHPPGTDAGPLWAINGNLGPMYLFTADGFFVTQLFQDVRTGKPWNVPLAQRNMLLNDLSPHDENFFPTLTQTPDGEVYITNGGGPSLIRVDGLGTIHRLPNSTLEVTKDEIQSAQNYLKQAEADRQSLLGPKTLEVALHPGPAPSLDAVFAAVKAGSWATQFAIIDQRVVKQGWADRPDLAKAAIAIAGGRLYAVYRTNEPNLLVNSGVTLNTPFKTGGALDLMIGADPRANPARQTPVAGDLRLLVYRVNGQTKAMLFRAVVPGTKNPVPFTSPGRTVTFDQVQDVSSLIDFKALDGESAGTFVFSIPVDALGLKPQPGERIQADIGLLRGSAVETLQRVYWSNKATGITSDVPSEAELTPNLWGQWIFKAAP